MNHRKANKYFPKRRVWDGIHLVILTGVATATNDDTRFELISILSWPSPFITFIFSSAVGCFKLHLTISQLLSEYYVSERDEMDGVTFQRDSPPLSDAKHCHCWSWRKKENENLYLISIVSVLSIYVFMFIQKLGDQKRLFDHLAHDFAFSWTSTSHLLGAEAVWPTQMTSTSNVSFSKDHACW